MLLRSAAQTVRADGGKLDVYWDDLSNYSPSVEVMAMLDECRASGLPWPAGRHDEAKKLLRVELMTAQQGRCGYCRRLIKNEVGHCEIDHILPKAASKVVHGSQSNENKKRRQTTGYPSFTFTIWNLVLTCKRCNNKKGTYDCRSDRRQALPSTNFYNLDPDLLFWIHPYLHRYSDHISLRENIVYQVRNNSVSGNCVIVECKLDQISAVEVAAREVVLSRSKNWYRAIGELIANVELINPSWLVNEVVRRFPNSNRADVERAVQQMTDG